MALTSKGASLSQPETSGATGRGSVSTAELMAQATRGSRSSEWAGHKDTIRRLYLEENMSLNNMMDYMRLHHNFSAS